MTSTNSAIGLGKGNPKLWIFEALEWRDAFLRRNEYRTA